MPQTHKQMRGFQYLLFSMFSSVLLFVLVLLPLNPVFADEIASGGESASVEPVAEAAPQVSLEESHGEPEVSDTDVADDRDTDPVDEDIQTQGGVDAVESVPAKDGDGGVFEPLNQEEESLVMQPSTDLTSTNVALPENNASTAVHDLALLS